MDVYDQLLELQAEASFGLERRLFQFEEFEQARSVIDLGCGNASFAMRLASAFPHKHFLGVDPNGSLLARGRARAMPRNLELFEGDFDALPAGAVADVLVARLMMMYVKEPEALARSASGRIPTVIVVDIADDLFDVRPALPCFAETFEAAREMGNLGERRDMEADTAEIWGNAGYELVAEEDVVVQSSSSTSMKPLMHLLMVLNAERVVGTPLSPPLIEELHGWVFDDSAYLQYGLRARRFERRPQTVARSHRPSFAR